MKKIKILAMVLGLVLCLTVIAQAQPSIEWARIKALALSGTESLPNNPGQWTRVWAQGTSVWMACYDYRHNAIQWYESWYKDGKEIVAIMSYWESSGKFQGEFHEDGVLIKRGVLSYETGINSAKQFLSDIKVFLDAGN